MNEKIYKTMGRVGGGNIAMGAVLVVVGVATGVLMIVSGAGLLKTTRGNHVLKAPFKKKKCRDISEARAPMRYAGVSDSRGENNAERGNEDEAGDESQNPRCGTDFILVYLLALVYFLFFAEEYGRRNFFELDYRYNLVPFQEIRRFWIYREKVGFLAAF